MQDDTAQHEPAQVVKGVLAQFDDPSTLLEASRRVRDAGFTRWDSYTPFPVHGIERAMGIRMTGLPWLVLMAGVAGGLTGLLLQWWTNAIDYPFLISGKPLFSLPANIPVVFELIVLFSALAAFAGTLAFNGLPRFNHSLFRSERFRLATSDRFFIAIESSDPKFDEGKARDLLESTGAIAVETVHAPATVPAIPSVLILIGIVLLLVAAIPPLWIAKDRLVPSDAPRVHPVPDMDNQPKLKSQAMTSLFADRRAMRTPVAGTIPRGGLRDEHFTRGTDGDQFADTFPEELTPVTLSQMKRGQQRFDIYCAPCHGLAGDGDGMTSQRALAREDSPGWVKPLSLHSEQVRTQPVGQLFNTITNGVRTMPSYASQILPEDRWAIVLYVKALQRSQNAVLEDLPPEARERLKMRDLK